MKEVQKRINTIINSLEKGNLKKAITFSLDLEILNNKTHLNFQLLSSHINKMESQFNLGLISEKNYWNKHEKYSKELAVIINDFEGSLSFSSINNTRTIGLPNKNFIGRDKLIDKVFDNFNNGERIQVLHGMSGIGKTRIALEYTYKYEKEGLYSELIWWVRSDNQILLENDFLELADRLGIRKEAKEKKIILFRKITNWLERHENWLLVFDNLSSFEVVKEYIPIRNGHILITSLNPYWSVADSEISRIEVKGISDKASAELIINRSGNKFKIEDIIDEVEIFEGYPVMLELVGAYFEDGLAFSKHPKKPLSSFLKKEFRNKELQEKLWFIIYSLDSVFSQKGVRFSTFWFGAAGVVNLLVWLAPRQIPRYLFEKYVDFFDSKNISEEDYSNMNFFGKRFYSYFFQKFHKIQEAQTNMLKVFAKKSIVTNISEQYLDIHPIVQYYFLELFKTGKKYRQRAMIFSISDLLYDEFRYWKNKPERIEENLILLPHVLAFLDKVKHFEVKVDSLLKLLKEVIEFLLKQEQFHLANQYAEQAYSLEKKIKGKATYDVIRKRMESSLITENIVISQDLLKELRATKEYELYEELYFVGIEAFDQNDFEKAYDSLVNCIQLIENKPNISKKYKANCNIYAGVAAFVFNREEGERYFKKAKEILLDCCETQSEEFGQFYYIRGLANL